MLATSINFVTACSASFWSCCSGVSAGGVVVVVGGGVLVAVVVVLSAGVALGWVQLAQIRALASARLVARTRWVLVMGGFLTGRRP